MISLKKSKHVSCTLLLYLFYIYRRLKINEQVDNIPDADSFANQLIEEVKMTHRINESEIRTLDDDKDTRSGICRRSLSPSSSRSRSRHNRSNSGSRSPHHRRSRQSSRSSVYQDRANKSEKSEKKYTEYASDSDFSSDSD